MNEIENLMMVNNDLGIKCRLSSQNYSHILKKKQSTEEENYVAKAEESHLKQMSFLKRSIDQLKVSFFLNLMDFWSIVFML